MALPIARTTKGTESFDSGWRIRESDHFEWRLRAQIDSNIWLWAQVAYRGHHHFFLHLHGGVRSRVCGLLAMIAI